MPNRVRVLTVPDKDRAVLERRVRDRGAPARVAERARIVLLSADGLTGPQIAGRVGCTEPTVVKWRRQYAEGGLAGLEDAPRPGGPKRVLTDQAIAEILSATVTPPPEALAARGVTHWSSRRLAGWLRQNRKITVSHDSISRLWRRFCLAPHRTEGFKFSTDPQLEARITDVVGLYLNPPDNAVVVCVDEKSQVQALERSQPILPMRPGIPERQTHDYARHGVTCLFAALNTATGQVTDACYPRHRHQEFLRFLKKVAAAYPGQELHVICDNYATHKHPGVKAWLEKNPRVRLHFTPTGCSWLNLVECFFSVITRQAIRRGSFTSVRQLVRAIGAFTGHWNAHPRPFTWTKDADEILASINRAKTKTSALTNH
ncbi:MAG TPA: IS630 family transposase [Streptosporangiaceae bacterium]|jgi:transposase|nr:IS630 family transposase [Streptosporangiaceae bacterium]